MSFVSFGFALDTLSVFRAVSQKPSAPCVDWSDMVCFYQGCSFGFEGSLKKAGVVVRNVEQGRNVSMYKV